MRHCSDPMRLPFEAIGGERVAVPLADRLVQETLAPVRIVALRAGEIHLPVARLVETRDRDRTRRVRGPSMDAASGRPRDWNATKVVIARSSSDFARPRRSLSAARRGNGRCAPRGRVGRLLRRVGDSRVATPRIECAHRHGTTRSFARCAPPVAFHSFSPLSTHRKPGFAASRPTCIARTSGPTNVDTGAKLWQRQRALLGRGGLGAVANAPIQTHRQAHASRAQTSARNIRRRSAPRCRAALHARCRRSIRT